MKILWVSPFGDGWSIAYRLREAGNRVVYANLAENGNGRGFLPEVPRPLENWPHFARRADLVFVDATPPSRRTRRGGFEASDVSLELARLRFAGVPVIGPTPTTELLQNDPRYQRKILARLGLPVPGAPGDESEIGVRCTVSRGPLGQASLLFREIEPEGHLVDYVYPLAAQDRAGQQFIDNLADFAMSVQHSSYLNVDVTISANALLINRVVTEPRYPAVFCQLGDLLGTSVLALQNEQLLGLSDEYPPRPRGLAVTLYRLQNDEPGSVEGFVDEPGCFGGELSREQGEQSQTRDRAHGLLAGAIVGGELEWVDLAAKVQAQVLRLGANRGWRYSLGDTDRISASIEQLRHWQWISG